MVCSNLYFGYLFLLFNFLFSNNIFLFFTQLNVCFVSISLKTHASVIQIDAFKWVALIFYKRKEKRQFFQYPEVIAFYSQLCSLSQRLLGLLFSIFLGSMEPYGFIILLAEMHIIIMSPSQCYFEHQYQAGSVVPVSLATMM